MNLQCLKEKLPHGAIKDISIELGISAGTVRNALNSSDPVRCKTHLNVINTALKYLEDYKKLETETGQKLKQVLQS